MALSSGTTLGLCEACCNMTPCGCLAMLARNETHARMHGTGDRDLESESTDEMLLPAKCLECDHIVLGGGLCSSCRNNSCSSSSEEKENQVMAAPMVKLSEGMQRLEIGSAQRFAANTMQPEMQRMEIEM